MVRQVYQIEPEGVGQLRLMQAMEALGVKGRFNRRTTKFEFLGYPEADSTEWQPLDTERGLEELRGEMSMRVVEKSGKGMKPVTMSTASIMTELRGATGEVPDTDPFREWLEELPAWDGTPRLTEGLRHFFEVDEQDADLARWVLRIALVGAIARTYKPGAKHDQVPVLLSRKQGIGKSWFWDTLLPREEWFADSLNLAGDDKQRAEALTGKVIVEASELRGTRRADIESIKAFLSRRIDHVRLAYRRDPANYPRYAVVVGTTNDEQPLPDDPSGNRRFIVVGVRQHAEFSGNSHAIWMSRRMTEGNYREQLWAEALAGYRQGGDAAIHWLPPDATAHQERRNQNRMTVDEVLETRVLRALDEMPSEFTMNSLMDEMADQAAKIDGDRKVTPHLRLNVWEQRMAASVLRDSGCSRFRRKRDGVHERYWVKGRQA